MLHDAAADVADAVGCDARGAQRLLCLLLFRNRPGTGRSQPIGDGVGEAFAVDPDAVLFADGGLVDTRANGTATGAACPVVAGGGRRYRPLGYGGVFDSGMRACVRRRGKAVGRAFARPVLA